MCSFSCVLWAIFWSFPLLGYFLVFSASVLRQIARIFLITQTEMPQKLIPNQHTINSKQFLRVLNDRILVPTGKMCIHFSSNRPKQFHLFPENEVKKTPVIPQHFQKRSNNIYKNLPLHRKTNTKNHNLFIYFDILLVNIFLRKNIVR